MRSVRFERCDLTEADFTAVRVDLCELRGCTLDDLAGMERLRGAAMPWSDIVGNAGRFAGALGIRVLDEGDRHRPLGGAPPSPQAPPMSTFRAAALCALAAFLVLAPGASAKKTHSYRVKLTFHQTRPWTSHFQQTSPDCTRTDDGDGLDVVSVKGKALLNATERGVAGFGLYGQSSNSGVGSVSHSRTR